MTERKSIKIEVVESVDMIGRCFETFLELRPHLRDKESFVEQVLEQAESGYRIFAIVEEDEVAACMGFRVMTTLAWGRVLYIDDLITKVLFRGKGYGGALLRHGIGVGRDIGCDQVHLDSGYARNAAHRMYLKNGFELSCHHFGLRL